MTVVSLIKKQVLKYPRGKPFLASAFRTFASDDNIRQVMNRMVQSGEVERIARGIYMREKQVKYLKHYLPPVQEILNVLKNETGEAISVHGAEAARLFEFTTQTPLQHVYYTTGSNRNIKLKKITIHLVHRNQSKFIPTNTKVGLAAVALIYLGKKQVTIETLTKLEANIGEKEFLKLSSFANKMPVWLVSIIHKYTKDRKDERELFRSNAA